MVSMCEQGSREGDRETDTDRDRRELDMFDQPRQELIAEVLHDPVHTELSVLAYAVAAAAEVRDLGSVTGLCEDRADHGTTDLSVVDSSAVIRVDRHHPAGRSLDRRSRGAGGCRS